MEDARIKYDEHDDEHPITVIADQGTRGASVNISIERAEVLRMELGKAIDEARAAQADKPEVK